MEHRTENVRWKQTGPHWCRYLTNLDHFKKFKLNYFLRKLYIGCGIPILNIKRLRHSCIFTRFRNVMQNYANCPYVWTSFKTTNLIFTNWQPWPNSLSAPIVVISRLSFMLVNRHGAFTGQVDLHISVANMNKSCCNWGLCTPAA